MIIRYWRDNHEAVGIAKKRDYAIIVQQNRRSCHALDNAHERFAKGQADRIKKVILGLAVMPQSHQDRLVGRYAGKGYKQLLIDNYMAVYRI